MAGTFGIAYAINKAALALLLRALRMDRPQQTAEKPERIVKPAPNRARGFRPPQPAVSH